MSFTSPWMLLFCLSALVPLWLHVRRKATREIAFPSVAIIQKVARKVKRPLRIREILLLILRALSLLVIALAASRPGITVKRPGGLRSGAPLALAIVLDNSLSMQLKTEDGQTVFEKAKKMALSELGRLRPGDAAALVFTCQGGYQKATEVSFDITGVSRLIQNATPTYIAGGMPKATLKAAHILSKSSLLRKEILVITDLSEEPIWGSLDNHPAESRTVLRVRSARGPGFQDNATVDQILVSYSPEGVAREALIEARVTNFASTPLENLKIVLEVDNAEVSRGTIDVPARGAAVKQFYHRFRTEGIHRGSVRIRSDRLQADDVRHFATSIRESIGVLIVDGDYRPGSYRDETFYLHRALETPLPGEVPLKTVVVDLATAEKSTLSEYEVVILAGVPELRETFGSRLSQYVEEGGGLFVSSSDQGGGLSSLDAIMPASVLSVRQAQRKDKPFRIGAINRAHPIFQPFASVPTGLEKTQIHSFQLTKPAPGAATNTLIAIDREFPLLWERKIDRGRVLFLTTTVDRDWTDLPIRPGFLPLVQRAVRHLAGRLDDRGPRHIRAGKPIQLEVSAGMQRLVVRGPGGHDTNYAAGQLTDKSSILFKGTNTPGHYLVWAEIPGFGGLRELPALSFVVEIDPAESDLKQISTPENQEIEPDAELKESTLPIWPHLLLAAMLLLLAETWLAGKGLRRSHRGRA